LLTGKRLLIVEDEETLRESLRRVLIQEGYDVDSAGSSEAGMKSLGQKEYDLVITDIVLPGMNGIQFLRECRKKNPGLKVIVITAFASIETAVEAIRTGAQDYIVKPIIHKEIKEVIRKTLRA